MHRNRFAETKVVRYILLLLIVFVPVGASAQLDRVRNEVWPDFARYFDETIRYLEQSPPNHAAALDASDEMARALGGIFDVSKNMPDALEAARLNELASLAEDFMDAIQDFRNRGTYLQRKLEDAREDFSSELDAFEDSYERLERTSDVFWQQLLLAGRGLKAACERGCFP